MIIHHLDFGIICGVGDDDYFYTLQAKDAVRWMMEMGLVLGPETRVLDLDAGTALSVRNS